MADNNFRSVRGRDPIAELARLIAQAYPQEESALADNGFREETASNGYDEPPGLPPAAQLPGHLNTPVELVTSLMSVATTTERMTPMINPAPPTRSIKIKFHDCASAA